MSGAPAPDGARSKMGASYDVFISYKSEDLLLAEGVRDRLAAEGLRVWFDKARLDPGCKWHEEIEAGCEASRIKLPVLTPQWQKSEWTRYETYGAETVIPLLFEGQWHECAPPPLLRYQGQMLDFTLDPDPRWAELVAAIRRYLAQVPVPPEKVPVRACLECRANAYFTGRDAEMVELHEKLFPAPHAGLAQGPAAVVWGLGGMGKTTLAREYAERFWRSYESIHWIRADQPLATQFADMAVDLGVIPQLTDSAESDAHRALAELASQRRRLLVMDNAPDEATVQSWIPGAGGCHTIVTSRYGTWSPGFATLHLRRLSVDAATEFLQRRCAAGGSAQEAAALGEQLGRLPLALEQAAAFVCETQVPVAQYLELHRQSRQELLARQAPGSTQHWDPVATTWQITVAKLSPLAQAILRLAAFLASEGIPRDLFEGAGKALPEAAAEIACGETALTTPLSLVSAFGELARYSMIELDETTLGVHRLVQDVERDRLDPVTRARWAERAVALVDDAFPRDEFDNWGRCAQLVPHVVACVGHLEKEGGILEEAARLLNDAAYYLHMRADYAAAQPLCERALAMRRLTLGEEHPDFATTLGNLGTLYADRGDPAAGEELIQRAMEIDRRALGERHPRFAVDLGNLAALRRERGDREGAETLFLQALEIQRQSLGEQDPEFALGLNNLGALYYEQGRYEEAEPLLWQALEVYRQLQGDDDPRFGASLNNLSALYHAQGDHEKAEPMAREALGILRRSLGSQHPYALRVTRRLADICEALGNQDEATALRREAEEGSADDHQPQ